MSGKAGIITFKDVTYEYNPNKPILVETSFTVRRGAKLTLMGQNGAGKSTLFGLIMKKYHADDGDINILPKTTTAISRQIIPQDEMDLTVRAFFERSFDEKKYNIDPLIDKILVVVNLTQGIAGKEEAFKERIIRSFSGGQQARLLLASALIQNPDVLLLDEPTNNLDKAGIAHLTAFLKEYKKTVIVISHDSDFLNAFTEGVLYLNVQTQKVEKFDGNYNDVVKEISAQVAKEQRNNARLGKEIQAKKDKANFFANKGGRLRAVAKQMREQAQEHEDNKVEVRKEDRTIGKFTIPMQPELPTEVLKLTSYKVIIEHEPTDVPSKLVLRRDEHLQIIGPNGIGKTTLLESLASGHANGEEVADGVKIGYYRQDFSNLDFDQTVRQCLLDVMDEPTEEAMRKAAAGFMLFDEIVKTPIGLLSEGQKGLVAFCRLMLMQPGLLILDEPTNHINFRHIPVIAKALNDFAGPMILVSHVPEFVEQIRIDQVLDLGKGL